MGTFSGKTVVITGSTRGIGRSIALKVASEGANVVILGKTTETHPKLPGTIHSVAEEVAQAGGQALGLQLDVRDSDAIDQTMEKIANHFGGIDVLVNNASAISLTPTTQTTMKKFDLMFAVNVRATFACSRAAIPFLIKGNNPHILNMGPPLVMKPKWFQNHVAYTMSKYGMSMCTLGMAEELKEQGVAVNSLWPKTTIATAAVEVHFPKEILQASRKPEIVADAAYTIISKDSKQVTGHFFIDETVLKNEGVKDFTKYALDPETPLFNDLYVEEA